MTKLEADELEFAKRHLERFEDTDFFPENVAYQAIWDNWDEVRSRLMAANVQKLPLVPAISMPIAKGKSTYRIVHQLDPITCLVYTSLTFRIGAAIEAARPDVADKIACSNRFIPNDGAFFANGSGYGDFRAKSGILAKEYKFGATADISDFYNQIYSHRVRASIESADRKLEETARDYEAVVHAINAGASKGIPVGPIASNLAAEAVLMDVDQLLARHGFVHTRYMDDMRIFNDDRESLQIAIEIISDYLYDNHRLHLNGRKTNIYSQESFLEEVIKDHLDEETEAAINRIAQFDPYSEIDPDEVPEEDVVDEIGKMIIRKFINNEFVDLNLIKAYIRRARLIESNLFIDVAQASLGAFIPVFHELAKAMNVAITKGQAEAVIPLLESIQKSGYYRRKSIRRWFDWVCAGSDIVLKRAEMRDSVFAGDVTSQARAAVSLKDLAWVRSHRANFMQLPPVARSAVMNSMTILGGDERKAILSQVDDAHASPIDVAMKRYLLKQ